METYCIFFYLPHSDVLSMTSNIATKEIAEDLSQYIIGRGGQVLCVISHNRIRRLLEHIEEAQ